VHFASTPITKSGCGRFTAVRADDRLIVPAEEALGRSLRALPSLSAPHSAARNFVFARNDDATQCSTFATSRSFGLSPERSSGVALRLKAPTRCEYLFTRWYSDFSTLSSAIDFAMSRSTLDLVVRSRPGSFIRLKKLNESWRAFWVSSFVFVFSACTGRKIHRAEAEQRWKQVKTED
jgi:hypothetical protein